jgi:hypothetical protein
MLGGNVVSVTTDGFLTNVKDLEKAVISIYASKSEFNQLTKNLTFTNSEASAKTGVGNSKGNAKPKSKSKSKGNAKPESETNTKTSETSETSGSSIYFELSDDGESEVFSLLREYRKVRVDFSHKHPEDLNFDDSKAARLKYAELSKTNDFYDNDPAQGLELSKQGVGLLS